MSLRIDSNKETEIADLVNRALGSAYFVLKNKHNKNTPEWETLAEAALEDIQKIHNKL